MAKDTHTQTHTSPRQSHMDSLGASLSPPVHWNAQWTSYDTDNGQKLSREYTHARVRTHTGAGYNAHMEHVYTTIT